MAKLRYDLISASIDGIKEHPQVQIGKLGINYNHSYSVPIGDCWIFNTDDILREEELPNYISVIKDDK